YLKNDNIHRKILMMRESLDTDTELAIGTSKEFVETVCKTILKKLDSELKSKSKFPDLVMHTMKVLDIKHSNPNEDKISKTLAGIVTSLTTLTHNIAELRNIAGTGHGKDNEFDPVDTEYARLVVNSASTLVVFLLDMFKKQTEHIQK
ncbi:MAG: abortive infection family protein, partial [Thaumarchaeota archaeon]|nr:abortive infection family protein [Nitrososphaerota archaeon]